MNFCEDCNKIVPDSEVKDLFNNGVKTHVYDKLVDLNENRGADVMGSCLVNRVIWCGNVREPDEQEYFIYHTLELK